MENRQSIVLNLADRYAAAFGMSAGNNAPQQVVVVNKEDNKYNLEFYGDNDTSQKMVFEYDHVRLEFNSMIGGDNISVFAPEPILSFSRDKNLIETEISGSDTVIVERWGTKQWNITINGVLIDMENHLYPNSEVQDIVSLFEHNGIIKVVGEQFYDKGIDSFYIISISLNIAEGYSDMVKYTITAKSIKEVGFNLLGKNE